MAKKALYLAGGGARGAYQAGALRAISDILKVKAIPFTMISGVSVGSLNAGVLATFAHDFTAAMDHMEGMWRQLRCSKVFKASNYELSKSVVRNLLNIIIKQKRSGFLLDTSPLRSLIESYMEFSMINDNLSEEGLQTVEIISHCYDSNQTISFYQHYDQTVDDWITPRHLSQRIDIGTKTLMASSALPMFFPPEKIDGLHYGDGSIGLVAPLRGALRFSMDKILIIGNRQSPQFHQQEIFQNDDIGIAHILGSMLNGIFLDNLDRDIEMVNRMNDIARLLSLWKKRYSPWRPVETMHLRPSQDMGHLATEQYTNIPALLRVLLNLLGARSHSGDLLSFLLFEGQFTSELVDLGYKDTIREARNIEMFFKD